MANRNFAAKLPHRLLCITLAGLMATAPSVQVVAQNGAAMAVRGRAEGLQSPTGPEGPGSTPPQTSPGAPNSSSGTLAPGKIDTRYITPNAAVVVVLRPAQLLASPAGKLLPAELVAPCTGFNAADIDEVVAFGDLSNLASPAYGVTMKFRNPVRASSIPPERRNHVQLAELAGKKYLRSNSPMKYSLFGPNNKTLIAATEPALQLLVQSPEQPKSGAMIDRLREVAAGNDLYAAIDVAALRPYIQMAMSQAAQNIPPEGKQALELQGLIAATEITVNVSSPAPTSVILHCNDDAAAEKVEGILQGAQQKYAHAGPTEQPGGENPIAQALNQYMQRLALPFQPQRNGPNITWVHLDGQDPAQQQLVSSALVFVTVGAFTFGTQSMTKLQPRPALAPNSGAPPGVPGGPVGPEGQRP
jgi:hypothetical protein